MKRKSITQKNEISLVVHPEIFYFLKSKVYLDKVKSGNKRNSGIPGFPIKI